MSDLEAALAAIPKMSALELADRWQALGRGAAPRVPLRVLQRLYAQLLQEQALAGLSVEALEELAAVAAKAGKNKTPTPPPPRQLIPVVFTRNGTEQQVQITSREWPALSSDEFRKANAELNGDRTQESKAP